MYIYDQHPLRNSHVGESSWGSPEIGLGQPTGPLTQIQVSIAVTTNGSLGPMLGWDLLEDAIATWILNMRSGVSHPPDAFAQAVASYQQGRSLPINGILDFNTWFDMLCRAKAGIPLTHQTAQGVNRPVGLAGIVTTFGDPTLRNWESQNIIPITAPAGQKFTAQNTTRVHTLLGSHFNSLFTDIQSAGLWSEIFPSSGTYNCRTKTSYGKKPCGTRGIRFDQLSTHSWGITIDIRATDYPYYTSSMQRAGTLLRYPPSTITSIFQSYGFHWGLWFMNGELNARGRINFTGADPHHFQFATGY